MAMAASSVGAFEAKTNFSKLINEVEKGREFIITKHGKAVAKLSPSSEPRISRAEAIRQMLKEKDEIMAKNGRLASDEEKLIALVHER
jgi:prevent-host-death family protein